MISGVTMIISDRPSSERGRMRLISVPFRARRRAALVGPEDIALSADGLQIARRARIGFDLAPEARDLDVDGARGEPGAGLDRELVAAHRLARPRGQRLEQPGLRSGQADRPVAAIQRLAPQVEAE